MDPWMSSLSHMIFEKFPGLWDVEKYQEGQKIMEGMGVFSSEGEGLLLREEGLWSHGQEYFQKTRYNRDGELIVLSRPHPMFQLFFEKRDGLIFGVSKHQCGNDIYTLCMTWLDDDHFTQEIQVKGTRKDYRVDVRFRRSRARV